MIAFRGDYFSEFKTSIVEYMCSDSIYRITVALARYSRTNSNR